jgi:hypothetical protein
MDRIAWHAWALALTLSLPLGLAATEPTPPMSELLGKAAGHRILLIGEIHGTAEVPALVGDMAAQMLADDQPLLVGLEIPRDEQSRIDSYLDSAGTGEDRAVLLRGPFWTRDYQDGRSSVAMADLLERLRQLRLKSRVEVLALDRVRGTSAEGDVRDQAMAERLGEALEARPDVHALVLAGNFHTRVQKGAPWDENHQFMGYRLAAFAPYAVEIMGVAGSAWICTGAEVESCKARDFPVGTLEPGIELGDEVNARGHHGIWRLPSTSAALPAMQQAATDPM